jgi:ubiquinone/menaquinone biosynthesis C-methylase UbiE
MHSFSRSDTPGMVAPGSMQGWAPFYDKVSGILSLGQDRRLRERTVEVAGIKPGDRVLDVGCGTGTLALLARSRAGAQRAVFGIDVASDLLAVARHKAERAGSAATFRLGSLEDIPFGDDHFDVVISSLVFHHVTQTAAQEKGLREIYRVLKPGGSLGITDLEVSGPPWIRVVTLLGLGNHMVRIGGRSLKAMMIAAGFQNVAEVRAPYRLVTYLRAEKPAAQIPPHEGRGCDE